MTDVNRGPGKSVPGVHKESPLDNNQIIIRGGFVQNIGSNGRIENPKTDDRKAQYLAQVLSFVNTKTGLSTVSSQEVADGETTRVLIMPLSSTPGVGIREKFTGVRGGQIGASKNDVAVCWSCRVENVNAEGQSGQIGGVMIMDSDGARGFYEEIVRDPDALFETVKFVNKGEVRRQDGSPAKINKGRVIVILPNNEVGGNLSSKVRSKPFSGN